MLRRYPMFTAIAGLAMIAGLLTAWSGGEPMQITQTELLTAISGGTAPDILDVRTTREYERGHVPGAVRIPYHAVWLRRAEIPAAADERIVVYCSHGVRAALAMLQLQALGYKDIAYLQGQMRGWQRRGLPVRAGQQP